MDQLVSSGASRFGAGLGHNNLPGKMIHVVRRVAAFAGEVFVADPVPVGAVAQTTAL